LSAANTTVTTNGSREETRLPEKETPRMSTPNCPARHDEHADTSSQ
jgi:hypothetical protein